LKEINSAATHERKRVKTNEIGEKKRKISRYCTTLSKKEKKITEKQLKHE
jgi:hypothetical protein